MPPPIACDSISCRRRQGKDGISSCIENVSVSLASGLINGFCGPENCGKGLLLNILGLLEPPDSGSIHIQGKSALELPADQFAQLRNETFGFIFDHPCLLPSFSVAENVAMPLFRICGGEARAARTRTLEVLEFCGILPLENALVGGLNPSEQRLTSLARALVHRPAVVIATSPRGADDLLSLLRQASREWDLCVLWSGNREELVPHADRIIEMREGRITQET